MLIDVTRYGVFPTPLGHPTTNVINFRKLYASVPDNSVIDFGPGQFAWGDTVRRDRDNVWTRGLSDSATVLQGYGNYPLFLDGIREPSADGFAFTKAGRPDAFGILDTSIANGLGKAASFATQGRSVAYLASHALCLGRYDRDSQAWDYHESITGLTVRLFISPPPGGRIPENQAIAGIGNYPTHTPSPHIEFTGLDAGPGRGTIGITVRLAGDPPGMQRRATAEYGDPTKPHRVILVVNTATDTRTILVDGSPRTVVIDYPRDPGVTVPPANGRRLEPQKRDKSFMLGVSEEMINIGRDDTPDLIFHGYWVADRAISLDMPNDQARYLDPDCLGYFDPTYQPNDRLLAFQGGNSGGGDPGKPIQGRAAVVDRKSPSNNLGKQRTSDLTLDKGGILSAPTYGDTHERVRYVGGVTGFSHIKMNGGTYPTKFTDSELGGSHLGLSLFMCLGVVRDCKISRGGAYSACLNSSMVELDNVMLSGFAPNPDGGFLVLGGPGYANTFDGRMLIADNEDERHAFRIGFLVMEQAPVTASRLYLRTCEAGRIASTGYFLRLIGVGNTGGWKTPPTLDCSDLRIPDGAAGACYVGGPPNVWMGSIRTVSTANRVAGPGSSKVKLVAP